MTIVLVWRPRSERLNPVFALQQHTAPTAGVMAHVFPLMEWFLGAIFQQYSATHSKDVTRLPLPHYYLSLAFSVPRFVTNPAYLELFETANWTAYEIGRTRGALTATVERDIS
ncbi:transposable element Tcb1 transposase [Trichonephila clavipes]|nr:transposable element Tcb1 transposase [Trichonephila clavipes]